MASIDDIETELTLELNGNLTISKFIKASNAFLGYVDEITKAAAGDEKRPNWFVQVKKGSNLIGVVPQAGFNPAIIQSTYYKARLGIDQIHNISEIEDEIPEAALRDLKKLAEIVNEDTDVRLWVNKHPVPLSSEIAAVISDFYRTNYKDYGSVEGKLQVISERDSYRAEITDTLKSKPIKCYLPENLLSDALKLFGQRVEAYGKIKYRADGTITGIEVEEFWPFPKQHANYSLREIRGILKENAHDR